MNNSLPKILWIDDEIDLLRPHILLLEEKGYDVAITTTGKEGLGLIKDQNFDLVLIDQFMPGDDGKFSVKLITPIAMSENLNFAIREGGKTVGAGVVTKIIK